MAVAPGVEPIYEHGHGHAHDHGHITNTHTRTITIMISTSTATSMHHASPLKFLVNLICPGMVLLSFHLLGGRGVAAFAAGAQGA